MVVAIPAGGRLREILRLARGSLEEPPGEPLACISARMLSVPAGVRPRPRENRGQTGYPITRFMG